MKRIAQLPEPEQLTFYRSRRPDSNWEEMRDDALDGGMAAHRAVKRTTVAQQRCLCAFCEMKICDVVPDLQQDEPMPGIRIEHFHPKSDRSDGANWSLVWTNLWAVCPGGDTWQPDATGDSRHRKKQRLENLSCDAFKNHQINRNQLHANPSGRILSPDSIPPFPLLFQYTTDGKMEPDEHACKQIAIAPNHFSSTFELAQSTITHLNLNCTRLAKLRSEVVEEMDDFFSSLREAEPDGGRQTLAAYAAQLFSAEPRKSWPEFFSLFRWLLGDIAEQRLQDIGFAG